MPAFHFEDFVPEVGGVGAEDEVEGGGVGEPGFAFHFAFELAGAPAGVAREEAELLGGGKALADVHEFFDGVAHAELGHDVAIGKVEVGVEVAEGAGLDGAADEKWQFFNGVRQIGDERFADFVFARLREDQSESALGVVGADQNDGPMKNRPAQLAAIQQQLAFE